MIQQLGSDVISELRSGVALTSISQCVEELVLNSLDAGSSCVTIDLDSCGTSVEVSDNGTGIHEGNLRAMGNRYFTSKCKNLQDLQNAGFYGFRGEAIASFGKICEKLEIISRQKTSYRTFCKLVKKGKDMGVYERPKPRSRHGTTILAHGIFHTLPVRRKLISPTLDLERVRRRIMAIAIMHPEISFIFRNKEHVYLQTHRSSSILSIISQVIGCDLSKAFKPIDYTLGSFKMTGYVNIIEQQNKSMQFIFINKRLVLKTKFHKIANCILSKRIPRSDELVWSQQKISSPKTQDKHAGFIINIECPYNSYDITFDPAKTLVEFENWNEPMSCLMQCLNNFLIGEGYLSVELSDDNSMINTGTNNELDVPTEGMVEDSNGACLDGCDVPRKTICSSNVRWSLHSLPAKRKAVPRDSENKTSKSSRNCTVDQNEVINDVCGSSSSSEEYALKIVSDESKENKLETPKCTNDTNVKATKCSPCTMPCPQDTNTPLRSLDHSQQKSMDHSHQKSVLNSFSQKKLVNTAYGDKKSSIDMIRQDFDNNMVTKLGRQTNRKSPKHVVYRSIKERHNNMVTKLGRQTNRKSPKHVVYRSIKERHGQKMINSGCGKDKERKKLETVQKRLSVGSNVDGENVYGSNICGAGSSVGSGYICHDSGSGNSVGHNGHLNGPCINAGGIAGTSVGIGGCNGSHIDDNDGGAGGPNSNVGGSAGSNVGDTGSEDGNCGGAGCCGGDCSGVWDDGDHHNKGGSSVGPFCNVGGNGDDCSKDGSCNNVSVNTGSNVGTNNEDNINHSGSEWLYHYDPTYGQKVYVNLRTGNTSLTKPTSGSEKIKPYKKRSLIPTLHPFALHLSHNFTPWLPRNVSPVCESNEDESRRMDTMLKNWINPVFEANGKTIIDASFTNTNKTLVKVQHGTPQPFHFTKDCLKNMKVIKQLDNKFIVCHLCSGNDNLLVIVDQHAAHERVRLEQFTKDIYYTSPSDATHPASIKSSSLPSLCKLLFSKHEIESMKAFRTQLERAGITFHEQSNKQEEQYVIIKTAPSIFLGREHSSIIGVESNIKQLIKEQIEVLLSTKGASTALPATLIRTLNSQACHGAIRFGDVLSLDDCKCLMNSLSKCDLPFQCAHGRPSMVPLISLKLTEQEISKKDIKPAQLWRLKKRMNEDSTLNKRSHSGYEICR